MNFKFIQNRRENILLIFVEIIGGILWSIITNWGKFQSVQM